MDQGLLAPFCSEPLPQLAVNRVGDSVHYALADHGFGPESAIDIVCANLNRKARKLFDQPGHNRRTSYHAQIRTPVQALHFDVLVQEDLYPGSDPALTIYDTSVDGTADVNDPGRDVDRYDLPRQRRRHPLQQKPTTWPLYSTVEESEPTGFYMLFVIDASGVPSEAGAHLARNEAELQEFIAHPVVRAVSGQLIR